MADNIIAVYDRAIETMASLITGDKYFQEFYHQCFATPAHMHIAGFYEGLLGCESLEEEGAYLDTILVGIRKFTIQPKLPKKSLQDSMAVYPAKQGEDILHSLKLQFFSHACLNTFELNLLFRHILANQFFAVTGEMIKDDDAVQSVNDTLKMHLIKSNPEYFILILGDMMLKHIDMQT